MKCEELKAEMLKNQDFKREYERFDLLFEIRTRYTDMRMEFGLPPRWWMKPWTWKNYKKDE